MMTQAPLDRPKFGILPFGERCSPQKYEDYSHVRRI